MTPPPVQEDHISQIPAVQLLQQLGYTYVSPEEVAVERSGKTGRVLLEQVLAAQLRRLNRVRTKGRERPFTDDAIATAVEALRNQPVNDGLGRTSEKIYDLLTLGKSVDQTVDGETKGHTVRYVDWEHPRNNVFHVTAEFEVARTASHETRRPDIVCFVNGIPFIVIECKRPDAKDAVAAAVRQQRRNQEDAEIPHLFLYAQLLLAVNKNDGSYATTGTPPKFWAKWKEEHDEAALHALVNQPPRRAEHEKLFRGQFAYARAHFETLAAAPRAVTGQDRLLHALCRPERLIELTQRFIVFDEGGTVKKIARYQQYFTVRRTLERIRQRDPDGRRKGGVVWHTQGSGKSLTMVMLGKALALEEGIPNPRIVLVTDRVDLDEQIWKTFHQCGKDPVQARTGRHLAELLADDRVSVITTVLDKFETAARGKDVVRNEDADLFVLVDESHRSHYGEAHLQMRQALPRACFIGFTGTPLMKEEKNTARHFGGFIEPAYTIRDAVADEAVVPLLYEGRHVMQDVNQPAVDRMFDAMCAGLTPEQRADLKRKFASRDELNRLESRLYLIAWDVSQHFSRTWQGSGFKGQLAAPGKKEALLLKRFLDQFGQVTSAVLISAPDDRESADDEPADESVQQFWNEMMRRFGNEKEYNRALIKGFKHGETPDIIIVVNKLLTGFDAPRNIVLYIARKLEGHNLLQAIARVNRLHPGKDFGHILDYYGVITELNEALELYSSLEGKFDADDLDGALANVLEELKRLPACHDAVWDLFRDVSNASDEEAYEVALADPLKREEFYGRLSRFCRLLKIALTSLPWLDATAPATIERYKRDAVFFQRVRAAIKLRYAEEIDYRDYEPQIKKMLSTYVQADEVVQVVDPVNIFERAAFAREIDAMKSPRAKADVIVHRTKRTITEKMDEDPFFYRKFSTLLSQAIEDYHQARLTEAQYLARVTEIMQQVRDGRRDDAPAALRERDLARAFYGALKEQLAESVRASAATHVEEDPAPYSGHRPTPRVEEILAEAACEIERIITRHAVVRWRENVDAQNRMRNEMDDFLYRLQDERGFKLTLVQMDAIVETSLRIARNRTQDV
ncbi:MAG: type I restriction endonuclease subunit R [Candidatus Didemnitutus sp.]|nr:type I restriction endonuclease subunit R [Candidatus Didemnitutus sp.]